MKMMVFVSKAVWTAIRIKHSLRKPYDRILLLVKMWHDANLLNQQILIAMHFHGRISSASDGISCANAAVLITHFQLASVSSYI